MTQTQVALQEAIVVSRVKTIDYYYELAVPVAVFFDHGLAQRYIEQQQRSCEKGTKFVQKKLKVMDGIGDTA